MVDQAQTYASALAVGKKMRMEAAQETETANARSIHQQGVLKKILAEAKEQEATFVQRIAEIKSRLNAKTVDKQSAKEAYKRLMLRMEEKDTAETAQIARLQTDQEAALLRMEEHYQMQTQVSKGNL